MSHSNAHIDAYFIVLLPIDSIVANDTKNSPFLSIAPFIAGNFALVHIAYCMRASCWCCINYFTILVLNDKEIFYCLLDIEIHASSKNETEQFLLFYCCVHLDALIFRLSLNRIHGKQNWKNEQISMEMIHVHRRKRMKENQTNECPEFVFCAGFGFIFAFVFLVVFLIVDCITVF